MFWVKFFKKIVFSIALLAEMSLKSRLMNELDLISLFKNNRKVGMY